MARTDLPANRNLARDILLLEQLAGPEVVHWDRQGRWIQLDRFPLPQGRYPLSLRESYLVIMVPSDYGDRSGKGAGLEEFYVHRDLKARKDGQWVEIPHTYLAVDRRGGRATSLKHRYACLHIDWTPQPRGRGKAAVGDTVLTSLRLLEIMFQDPWTFAAHHRG